MDIIKIIFGRNTTYRRFYYFIVRKFPRTIICRIFYPCTRFSEFVSISRGRMRGREFQAVDRLAREKFEKVKFKSRKASLRAN